MLAISAAVLLALALPLGGFLWEQFVVPSRTVKQVNEETLTRREYDQLQRRQLIGQQIVQGLQFLRLFGNQSFGGQQQSFDQQVLQANFQLASLGTARSRREPVDDAQVEQWTDRQILEQYAQAQFQINPDQGRVDQALVSALGSFLPSEAVTSTDTLTGTDALSGTSDVTSTTATATPPPTATPLPEQATPQAEQIIDTLYTDYTNLVSQFAANAVGLPADQRTPNMTRDELATTLRDQFRQQVVQEQVGERLVPELPADTAEGTEFIQLRQIVLQVPPPTPEAGTETLTDTDTLTDTGAVTGTETLTDTGTVTGTAGITDTTQLSPEQLDSLFAQRLDEANGIVQQLRDNPDSFGAVAQEQSNDTATAAQGGEVGLIDRQGTLQQGEASLPQAVVDAAWALPDNGISDPIRTDTGWVIVQRQPEDPDDRLQRLRQDALTDWLSEQRANAQIVPAPSASPSPSEGPTPFTTEPAGEESASPSAEATTTP
jgi:parvulin-like peptidyl-prolyl isomerase